MMRLRLESVDKSYGALHALDHFSFAFEPGLYALLGPNGSGKSTLLNILTDNLSPDSGMVFFSRAEQPEEIAAQMGVRYRQNVGYLPQDPQLDPTKTALAPIRLFLRTRAAPVLLY